MSVVYTVGDFAVTQLGPTLFVVAAERIGTLAYFDNAETAERQGHEMARAHGVSLWRIEAGHPSEARLIISYRVSGLE
jgi:hypothetical protein